MPRVLPEHERKAIELFIQSAPVRFEAHQPRDEEEMQFYTNELTQIGELLTELIPYSTNDLLLLYTKKLLSNNHDKILYWLFALKELGPSVIKTDLTAIPEKVYLDLFEQAFQLAKETDVNFAATALNAIKKAFPLVGSDGVTTYCRDFSKYYQTHRPTHQIWYGEDIFPESELIDFLKTKKKVEWGESCSQPAYISDDKEPPRANPKSRTKFKY